MYKDVGMCYVVYVKRITGIGYLVLYRENGEEKFLIYNDGKFYDRISYMVNGEKIEELNIDTVNGGYSYYRFKIKLVKYLKENINDCDCLAIITKTGNHNRIGRIPVFLRRAKVYESRFGNFDHGRSYYIPLDMKAYEYALIPFIANGGRIDSSILKYMKEYPDDYVYELQHWYAM